jgi:hypothetical protein
MNLKWKTEIPVKFAEEDIESPDYLLKVEYSKNDIVVIYPRIGYYCFENNTWYTEYCSIDPIKIENDHIKVIGWANVLTNQELKQTKPRSFLF